MRLLLHLMGINNMFQLMGKEHILIYTQVRRLESELEVKPKLSLNCLQFSQHLLSQVTQELSVPQVIPLQNRPLLQKIQMDQVVQFQRVYP